MKWVNLWVSALCALNIATAAAQEAPDIAIFSFEDISCAAWTRSQGNELLRAHYGAWFRGFVSGYNFGNPANQATSRIMARMSSIERPPDGVLCILCTRTKDASADGADIRG